MAKAICLWAGIAGIIAAFAAAGLSVHLIHGGIYPPDGNGSLGHLGMVIAGAILAFLGLMLGSIGTWLVFKASRRLPQQPNPPRP